ncbi:MAG: TonB-dependent receptor [Acidobacteria bacterium]|nr:TonB-dependent receptor [Acidobacteriota bacterium]
MLLRIVFSSLFLVRALAAQESRATLIGEVKDASGAVIVGASVKATSTSTGTVSATKTNDSGYFELPYLLPGQFRVEVELQGFKKAVRRGIELRVSDRLTLDFVLELGSVAESVVVTGETPLLEAATASIGVVIDERRVSELPMVGGNPFYLSRLAAGVLSNGGRSAGNPMDNGAATGIIANGTRGGSSEVSVDGSPNMTNRNAVFSPPQDLVQEFKIHTATYDASIGHAAGASTNVSMKSGSNQLHGTVYYFDSRIRAVPWFTNRFIYDPMTGPINQQKFDRNVPSWFHQRGGVTMSGPVRIPKIYDGRNRTFWTFGFEDLNITRNLSLTGTVPTAAEHRGDFSALNGLGARYQIFDPFSIVPAPGGRFARTPLPNNVVPASRIHPVALNLLKFYPEANQAGTADASQNYFRTRQIARENYTVTQRVDHTFTEKNRFFLRWNNSQHDNKTDTLPGAIFEDILDRTGWGIVADDVHVFSAGLLLNIRYGISYQSDNTTRGSAGFDITALGLPASLRTEISRKLDVSGIIFPQTTVNNYTALGLGAPSRGTTNYHTAAITLTNIRGSHSMRYGSEYRLQRETGFAFGFVNPQLAFGTTFTNGPLDNSPASPKGQGLASLLFGVPTGGVINNNASRAEESSYLSFFGQDDWRLTSKLTVNLGLRYEYEKPPFERYNRSIRGFDGGAVNPTNAAVAAAYARSPIPEVPASAFRLNGGLTFAGVGGNGRSLWQADRNNFAPRVGIAYALNKKTVIRSGYGIFFDVLGVDRNGVNQGGFNQPTNLIPSLNNGQSYVATLSNPFPNGIESAQGAAGGLRTFLGRGISFFYDRPANPYMQRWSLSIQRELPGKTVLDLAYVGNRGTQLPVQRNVNAVPREYMSTLTERDQPRIDFLSAQVNSPFFGHPDYLGTGLANQRVGRAQLLRPHPHFGDILVDFPAGYSHYHSLQLSAEKRYSAGLSFQLSWTYSKFMEAVDYLNDTDPYLQKVISPQDFTHRFVLSGIYELPVGRGKRLLGNANRWVNGAVGGWQFQGWFEGQTGDALGFGNAIFRGRLEDVALPLSERRAERWFNTDAGFERNPQNQLANNIRTLSARFNGIRADGINNFDLSLFKNFAIRERMRAQFRLETFNSLNHVQFAAPNTTPTATAFGTIVDEKGHGQRQATMSLKFIF